MLSPLMIIAAVAMGSAPVSALAQAPDQRRAAEAFLLAAQTQDHKTALMLLDSQATIDFPEGLAGGSPGQGQGQPFVIGYLDGLFGDERELRVDSEIDHGAAVRFLAHDARSLDPFAIDVTVQDGQVVRVTVARSQPPPDQAPAAVPPSNQREAR